ncbi:MAG TPA: hypothetical protein VMW43_07870 [Bacteroidota bacterium]|nr:hypothetical protein [Bacteroidota bacterium]
MKYGLILAALLLTASSLITPVRTDACACKCSDLTGCFNDCRRMFDTDAMRAGCYAGCTIGCLIHGQS